MRMCVRVFVCVCSCVRMRVRVFVCFNVTIREMLIIYKMRYSKNYVFHLGLVNLLKNMITKNYRHLL